MDGSNLAVRLQLSSLFSINHKFVKNQKALAFEQLAVKLE